MTGSIEDLQNRTEAIGLADGDEISHVDITARIPEKWAGIIESEAKKERIFRPLCRVFTDLITQAGDTLKIPKKAVLDYATYGPKVMSSDLEEIQPNVEVTYETIPVTPVEVAIGARITKQAIAEAMVSIIDDALSEMGWAVAQKEDLDIVEAITATTAGEEVTFIEARKDGAPFVTGKWTVAKAGTFSQTTQLWSANQTNLAAGDIIDLNVVARAKNVIMAKQGFSGDALIIHPEQQADFMVNPQFLEAAKSGDTNAFRKGYIGSIFGLGVYVSQNLPKLKCGSDGATEGFQAILLDTRRAVAMVIKRPVTIETKYEPGERMHYIFITSMYKAKRTNDGAVVLINTV